LSFKTIEWTDEGVVMIDQRKLPTIEEYPVFKTYREVAEAIRVMVIRGAPAIGVAAAMGIALGVRDSKSGNTELREDLRRSRTRLRHASDRSQFVLGDRADETSVQRDRDR
jgi:methylthioribose-1-phosphate isomerase